jgi:hypothetical protein
MITRDHFKYANADKDPNINMDVLYKIPCWMMSGSFGYSVNNGDDEAAKHGYKAKTAIECFPGCCYEVMIL